MAEVILLFLSVFILLRFPTTKADYLGHYCINTTGTVITPNYKTNLNHLLSTLASNATRNTGFYNSTSAGRTPNDTVYGLFLCRGDLTTAGCKTCVTTATSEVMQRCPVEKGVVIWYDDCMLRYSENNFFSVYAGTPRIYTWNDSSVSSGTNRFNQVLGESMMEVTKRAANDGWKFATRKVNFTGLISLYSLGQCTQDLSSSECTRCFVEAIAQVPGCCGGKLGGRVLFPSCNVRFEVYPFYNSMSAPAPAPAPGVQPLSPPSSVKRGKSKISWKTIVVIAVPIAVTLVLFVIGYCLVTKRARKKYNAVPEPSGENDIATVESLQFDFGTIGVATNNFSDDNKLGEGGFGKVYKGLLLDGQEIAVKRLSRNSGQGADEFKTEMVLLAKLQHRNLVRLLGFCLDGEEKILLYEYVPNKSLDYILFDPEKQGQLDWSRRYNIIAGTARGIMYLHEDSRLRIIHRDLKASNILLDGEMHPKISDFGMARVFGVDQTQANTDRIVGTYGYMSPEYAMRGQFSVKSDLYSFGVIVLEIISGKKNSYFCQIDPAENLASHAWKLWRDGTPLELLDPCLRDSYSRNEVIRCIQIGLLCVQEDPAHRPTMQSLVLMLNSHSASLPLPHEPAFFHRTRMTTPRIPLESNVSVYDGSITEVYPR